MLFASVQKKEPDLESLHSRIESGSIGEAEYESLYDQHFPSDHSQDGGNLIQFFLYLRVCYGHVKWVHGVFSMNKELEIQDKKLKCMYIWVLIKHVIKFSNNLIALD